ncbi:hypothetical protein [Nostoc sp.]|uniref:hypothetical protein n=1 Tax=Nostoc sp. TaxID=1180 RepID=UPI002FFAB76B
MDGLRGIKEAVRPSPYSPLGILRQALASPNVKRPRWLTAVYLRIWVIRGAIAFS